MKKLEQMSEIEINNLTDAEIENLIKLAKLENGIKLLKRPLMPDYLEVKDADVMVYKNPSIYDIKFTDENELKQYNELLSSFKSIVKTDYSNSSDYMYILPKDIKISAESSKCYSQSLYKEIKEVIFKNNELKKRYESELREWRENEALSKDIVSEIENKVYEIKQKYYKLNGYCRMFKNDYLPLSENKEKLAIAFFEKAYTISESDKAYILENYKIKENN